MTAAILPAGWSLVDRGLRRLERPSVRPFVVLAAVLVAYHYSLTTLLGSLGFDTPLAYLSLVPIVAVGMAWASWTPRRPEPAIHDRQIDYIVGLPLVAAAAAVLVLEPVHLSTMFWEWRVDLLSLPLFVAGALCLTFGVRTMWRLRRAVGFLLLAWPVPYTLFLTHGLELVADATLTTCRAALRIVPVAVPAASADGSLFSVGSGVHRFVVSVGSSCAGANGVIGFLVVGGAIALLARGRLVTRLLWLLVGIVLAWALNVVRLLLVFAAGARWGEDFAIDGLHPFIGIVLFDLAGLVMLAALPLFGLRLDLRRKGGGEAGDSRACPAGGGSGDAVARPRLAVIAVIVLALLLAMTNASFRAYDATTAALGAPRLTSFEHHPPALPSWSSTHVAQYDWAKRYFGRESRWDRFLYTTASRVGVVTPAVVVDAVITANLRSLSAYGVEACYRFHDYRLKSTHVVDLGGGVTGTALSYVNPKTHAEWTSVYWRWRVNTSAGSRYERVIVMMQDQSAVATAPGSGAPAARRIAVGMQDALQDLGAKSSSDPTAARTQTYLTGFARDIVRRQAAAAASGGVR